MSAISMTGVLLCNLARSEFETEFTDPDTNVILPTNNVDVRRRSDWPATFEITGLFFSADLSKGQYQTK